MLRTFTSNEFENTSGSLGFCNKRERQFTYKYMNDRIKFIYNFSFEIPLVGTLIFFPIVFFPYENQYILAKSLDFMNDRYT